MSYTAVALSDADRFACPRFSQNSSQNTIRNAILFCLAVMGATWGIAAIRGGAQDEIVSQPQQRVVAERSAPQPVAARVLGPDPIFVDPGATSAFSRDYAASLPANAFQLAAATPPAPITIATAANAQPTPEVAAADVPLAPVRTVPTAVADVGGQPGQDAPTVFANVPLPPIRDVPAVIASAEPAPVPDVPVAQAEVPLPPVRAVPTAVADMGGLPSQDASSVFANVPLPPIRDVPFVVASAEPAPASVPDVPVAQAEVPLPPARPAIDMPIVPQPSPRVAARPAPARTASQAIVANLAPPASDNRNFVQKLLNLPVQTPGPVLAYAKPEDDGFSTVPNYARPTVPPLADGRTAIYDISAHTVYLPNGEQLEAHSGLGNRIDNPSSVNEKDRGATPPHVYDLSLRGQLFHGVQALRLTPVGGGNMYGRVGLLAHTYMLGPSGQSNGCVSFRDYRRFLQAYQSGAVTHLVVVAHRA
jgi:hypothetical protein